MKTLLHQYLQVALGTCELRRKLLSQPLMFRSHIQYQDWILAGSLHALHHQGFLPPQPEEKPATTFVHTWLSVQSMGQQGLKEIAERFDAAIDQPAIRNALGMALRCSALDITEPAIADPLSADFCCLLASEARSLPTALLERWIISGEDPLQAAALERMAAVLPENSDWLKPHYAVGNPPETRITALVLAANRQDEQALKHLQSLDETALEKLPAALFAAWFHPDIYREHSLKLAALSGRPDCIPALLNALEQPQHARMAEQAWLWLTGQQLAHMPPVANTNTNQPHTSPRHNTLPDARLAHEWWQKQSWDKNQRYFLGQPVSADHLQQHFRNHCGQVSVLIRIHPGRNQACSANEPYGLWLNNPGRAS